MAVSPVKAAGLVFALSAALAVSGLTRTAPAQEAYDPEDTVYATGAIFASEEELAGVPRTPLFRTYLPPSVDLRDRFPPAGEQGEQGSCVGWAVGYAARSYYNSPPGGGARLSPHDVPSPAYIYNTIQIPDATCDGGSRIFDALNLLKKGTLTYAELPYDENRCPRPSASMVARATKFRIADWLVVDTDRLDQVKGELAGGHPVVVGMRTNRDFLRLKGRKVWRAGYPESDDGNRAVTVVGYSEPGQYFTVVNSWGRGWGDRGFGRISYDTFRKRVNYGYSMRLVGEPSPEPPKPEPPTSVVPELVLPGIECGRIAIEKRGEQRVVVGFVGTREDLAKIQAAATQSKVRVQVALRPWPQCEALMTIEKPLLQPSTPAISLPRSSFRVEETLSFDVRMADFQGYLHVAYIQADGNVVNLAESDALTLSTLPPRTKLRGRASWTSSRGKEVHHGFYKEGRKHGLGTAIFADGTRYTGQWHDEKQHGRGVFISADARYEGVWQDGSMPDRGTITYTNGDRFEGEWKDGQAHGHGIYTSREGSRYEGDFVDGKRHGRGVFTIASGWRYEGEWREGKIHGPGVYFSKSGKWLAAGQATNGCFGKRDGYWFYSGTSAKACGFE